ncbi:MAG: hypothetical protein ACOX8Q_08630 [Christensenellales bacterium]
MDAPLLSIVIKLNAFLSVSAKDYRIFALTPDGMIILSMIGHLYEDFALRFVHAYNEIIFCESLMQEKVYFETGGQYVSLQKETTHAIFRICETSLVILPDTHDLVRIPYGMFGKTEITPYRFEITDRLGRLFCLQKMCRNTDAFLKAYKTRFSALIKQTKDRLSVIAPVSDALAALMMEGIVAKLSDICTASLPFADALDKIISTSDISKEYGYLKTVSGTLAIGVKRGLMGELTKESIIILAPIFKKNIMIMETLGDSAAATYIFKISEEREPSAQQWDEFLLAFNYSMLSVNFRREPIYLSDEALQSENYADYNQALKRVPELKHLRRLFIGRVIHSSSDSWKKNMDSYIK